MKRRTHCEPVSHPVGESRKVIPTLSLIPALLGSPKGLHELHLNNMRPSCDIMLRMNLNELKLVNEHWYA